MKQLIVKAQPALSPMRTMSLTVAGIIVRLFRSLVTVVILALAVTFLCHSLAHSLIVHESRYHAYQQLREFREPSQWNTRLTSPDARPTIWANLAEQREPYITEYARWAGVDHAELTAVAQHAKRLREIQAYFEQLPEAAAIVLLEGRTVLNMLGTLQSDDAVTTLEEKLANMKEWTPPEGGVPALAEFARRDLPALLAFTEKTRAGHMHAIDQTRNAMDGNLPLMWFGDHESDILRVIRAAGYVINEEDVPLLAESGRDFVALERLKEGLEHSQVTTAMVRQLNVSTRELHVERLVDYVTNDARAEWLSNLLRENVATEARSAPSAERLLIASERYRTRVHLQRAAGDGTVVARTGLFDLPTNTQWLIMLSFLVCAVGVTNAMFMSVTERFTEIATMKCLGALDGFLMQMFLYESAIQGIIGATVGIFLGIGLAVLRGLLAYGGLALESMPLIDLMLGAGLSFIVGLLLAIVAGVGPALAVARLAPMEAMRIE